MLYCLVVVLLYSELFCYLAVPVVMLLKVNVYLLNKIKSVNKKSCYVNGREKIET